MTSRRSASNCRADHSVTSSPNRGAGGVYCLCCSLGSRRKQGMVGFWWDSSPSHVTCNSLIFRIFYHFLATNGGSAKRQTCNKQLSLRREREVINSRYFNSCLVAFLFKDVIPVMRTDTDSIHREDPKEFHLGSFGGIKGREADRFDSQRRNS